jgi:hypothetical protein
MVVLLNTTRGMCLPATTTYAQRVESVDGVKRLDHDTTIDADIVEFKPGASIITNGYYLAITANELRLSGDADIVSFEPRSPRPAGDDGRSGGSIIIQADEITGKRLKIDDHGEDGAKGSKGTQGSSGGKGTHGVGRHLDAFRGCIGSRLAGRGGVGGNGGPGGPGGNGGNGGTVTIRVGTGLTNGAVTRIAVVMQADDRTLAGHGGQRGDGGDAGPGGPGGDGAEGKHPCGGVPGGPSGPSGNRGPDGVDGRDGQGGAVVISR